MLTEENIVTNEMEVALDTPNELYSKWLPVWEQVKDIADGEKSVKDKSTTYLPKTGLMKVLKNGSSLYSDYKLRATFFNGTGRTVDGLLGLVYRKVPVFTLPAIMEDWKNDINLRNQSLSSFSKKYLEEVILKNRVAVLVDYPVKQEVSTSEAEDNNYRPFCIMFKAESILDWDEERINNIYKTSYVMLKETERKRDDLTIVNIEKRRVLDLSQPEEELKIRVDKLREDYFEDEEGFNNQVSILFANTPRYYRQRVFIKEITINVDDSDVQEGEERWILQEEIYPTDIKGNRFTEIPFFVTTDRGISLELDYSMTYDLSSINVSLYRNSADLENIIHVGSNPTHCAIGLKSSMLSNPNIEDHADSGDEQVGLGLNTLLEFSDGGSAWMLESSGKGAESVEKTMEVKRKEMALLGSRILASDPTGVETAETANIHRQGEQGVLSSAVDSINETFLKVLSFMYLWQTGNEIDSKEIDINFNKDYNPGKLSSGVVATAVQALQSGGLSQEEFFDLLQKGEWIKAEKTIEDHISEVKNTMEVIKKEEEPFNL